MIIKFRTREGKTFSETVKENLTLVEAHNKYSSPLFQVFEVLDEPEGTLSNIEACQIIANEGVGYAVQHYIRGSEFKDPETVKLWNAADVALDNLLEYLEYSKWEE
jgi:hypothetical protein